MNLYEKIRDAKIGDVVTINGRKGKVTGFHHAASCAICIAAGVHGCMVSDNTRAGIDYLPCLHMSRPDGRGIYIEACE